MLTDKSVLIIEDNAYLAMDLAAAIEEQNGRAVGPVGTLADATAFLDGEAVSGAVLDYELPGGEVTALARALADRRVPFVIHTSIAVGPEVSFLQPDAPVLMKPIQAEDLVAILAHEVIRAESVITQHVRI